MALAMERLRAGDIKDRKPGPAGPRGLVLRVVRHLYSGDCPNMALKIFLQNPDIM